MLVASLASAAPLTLEDLPAAVQKTVTSQVADGQLGDIDKTNQDGENTYDVEFASKAGVERDCTVADDGTLLSVEVTWAETPAAVQTTIRAEAAGWQLESIDKNVDDTEVSYDVVATKDGKDEKFTVAEDGDTLSEEVPLSTTPAAVQATIKEQVSDGSVTSVDEIFQPDGSMFDVDAQTKDGAHKSFSVSAAGQMLSEEIALAKVAPAARKTIDAKVGDGKVLRVDKSLSEKKDGVLPFKVQARKDGKPFNFMVGPRGRFLGMDN